MAETQVRKIELRVNVNGDGTLRSLKNSFKELNKTTKETSTSLGSIKTLFQSVLGATVLGVGIKSIVGAVDSMQKLNDRLVNTEGSIEKAGEALNKLRVIANATNSSVEDIAVIYARLKFSLSDLGLSTDAVLGLTIALKNTFRIAGATAEEATASVIQLSQGLASGALRGQELRSVLEQNALIGELLAKKLGIGRGALIKFGETGKITSKVVLETMAENFNVINQRAENLRPTVGESLTKAFNDLKFSVNELNNDWEITRKLADGIAIVFKNLNLIIGGAAILGAIKAYTKLAEIFVTILPLLNVFLGYIVNIGIAVGGFFTGGVGIAIGILAIFIIQIIDFGKAFTTIKTNILDAFPAIEGLANRFGLFQREIAPTAEGIKQIATRSQELFDIIQGGKDRGPTALANEVIGLGKVLENSIPFKTYGDALAASTKTIKDAVVAGPTLKKQLENLNTSFEEGTVSVTKYNSELLRLTKAINIKKGPTTLYTAIEKVKEANLGRELEYGIIKLNEYDIALNKLKLDDLKNKFNQGRISAAEFHKEVTETSKEFNSGSAFYTGVNNYIETSGTLAKNIAGNITLVFNTLEDTLFEFVKTGTFEFKKFAQAVLDDLTRIIIRAAVIQPLAQGILRSLEGVSNVGGSGDASSSNFVGPRKQALGGAWDKGTQFFANGGIVNRATAFGMAGGRKGVMGEAGPEAILPLTRGPGGKLGVSGAGSGVTVNVINNSGAEISQSESKGPNGEKVLDIIIANKTKELFANGGMDKTMKQIYGVSRRGA
jgi:tape measure domain-containing protein